MLYIPTLISIIEVLLVIVPALLSVAYVTVAERKTMASMQRRLGPNAVGQSKLNFTFKRLYSSDSSSYNYDNAINTLYINRKAPIKPFEENVISVCEDLTSSKALSTFFKDFKGKGETANPYLYTSVNCFSSCSKKVSVKSSRFALCNMQAMYRLCRYNSTLCVAGASSQINEEFIE